MLLLLSVRSPHKINQAPCSGLMSVFPWLRDGLLIRKAGVYKGVSMEPGWGLDFEHDNEPSATPSLETQPQQPEILLRSRFMSCPEQLRGALEWRCPWSRRGQPWGTRCSARAAWDYFSRQTTSKSGFSSALRLHLRLVVFMWVSVSKWLLAGGQAPFVPDTNLARTWGFFTCSS